MSVLIRRRFCVAVSLAGAFLVGSCAGTAPPQNSSAFKGSKAAWRDQSERACLSSRQLAGNRFITPISRLGGPGVCGALKPFKMAAADYGRVRLRPAAVLRCSMINPVDDWVRNVVSPAAARYLGSSVKELKVAASYSCRTRNGLPGAKLSEHGLANALDISAFLLDDGRKITLRRGWNGSWGERNFLRAVHKGACKRFTTVLGPDADRFHRDHFHFDLARHNAKNTYRVCR